MKIIGYFIGCIISLFSLLILGFSTFIFALLGRELYKWSRDMLKKEYRKLRIRWYVVKRRYVEILRAVGHFKSKVLDALFISSKQIANNTVKFVLMWSVPTIFILSVVSIVHLQKEKKYETQEKKIEMLENELNTIKQKSGNEKSPSSLNIRQESIITDSVSNPHK